MNSLYLELMDNFLGTELDAGFDSLSSRREVTNDQYNMLQEHWARVDRTVHEDLVRISPFSPFDADTVVVGEGGQGLLGTVDRPTSVLFSHPYNGLSKVDLDLIKRQALFFSRVAVVAPQPRRNSTPEEVGLLFSQFLKTLADLRPLIIDGTVELVPIAGFYSNEIEGGAGIVRNICASDPSVSKPRGQV